MQTFRSGLIRGLALAAALLYQSGSAAAQTSSSAVPESAASRPPGHDEPAAAAPLTPILRNLRFNGLIQEWYLAAGDRIVDTFRLRRAELKLSAEIGAHASWVVMIDPSKALSVNKEWKEVDGEQVIGEVSVNQASRILQDAYIMVTAVPRVQVSVGQMKLPLGLEGLASSSTLDTVERALFLSDRARGGSYGDVRELGAMVNGTIRRTFDYRVGVFNGAGQTQNDTARADRQVLAARLAAHSEWLPGLQLGASVARGVSRRLDVRQERTGFDAEYARGAVVLRTEWVTGQDAGVERRGWYVHGRFAPIEKLQVAARVDTWDPDTALDTSAATVRERDYVVGLTHLISAHHLKWQFNVVRKTFRGEVAPDRTQALANLQVSW